MLTGATKTTTSEMVRDAFERVSAKAAKAWVQNHFGFTITSRRNAAYADNKAALKSATV